MPTEFQRRGQEARLAGLPRHYEPSPIDGETGHAPMRTEFAQGWDEINEALRHGEATMSFSMTGRVAGEGYAAYRNRAAERLHELMSTPCPKGIQIESRPMAVGIGVFQTAGDQEYLIGYVSNGK